MTDSFFCCLIKSLVSTPVDKDKSNYQEEVENLVEASSTSLASAKPTTTTQTATVTTTIQGVFWIKKSSTGTGANDVVLLDMHAKEVGRKGNCILASSSSDSEGVTGERKKTMLVLRLGKSAKTDTVLRPGALFKIGKRTVELGQEIRAKEISTGRFFIKHSSMAVVHDEDQWRLQHGLLQQEVGADHGSGSLPLSASQEQREREAAEAARSLEEGSLRALIARTTANSKAAVRKPVLGIRRKVGHGFTVPWKNATKRSRTADSLNERRTTPLHNPNQPRALVLQRPSGPFDQKCTVPVVVDPRLSLKLRDHQRVGVDFLYSCVTGLRNADQTGCILADDMGLGKTLQCISLLYTLLRQGPQGLPLVKRAIIVCPSSLTQNWANEIQKWLPRPSTSTTTAKTTIATVLTAKSTTTPSVTSQAKDMDSAAAAAAGNEENQCSSQGSSQGSLTSISNGSSTTQQQENGDDDGHGDEDLFLDSRLSSIQVTCVSGAESKEIAARNIRDYERGHAEVFITSYDQLKIHIESIEKIQTDLIICDEGHRLKSKDTQVFVALQRVQTSRRILITGTPLQNNLDEFHTLVSFVNEKALGEPVAFQTLFLQPIMRSREKNASATDKETGRDRAKELTKLTQGFILRRENTVNERYLPAKCDLIVCVRLTETQKSIYEQLTADATNSTTGRIGKQALQLISNIRKCCTHPALVAKGGFKRKRIDVNESGKLAVLFSLLSRFRVERDRAVIISNYTQTLQLIETAFKDRGWTCFVLDGSTAVAKRQEMVDMFNRGERFCFFLSSKAGGVGLNLIGANRLIMLDADWNPAIDAQAMARVWRQGQPKKCFTYRLCSTGTIEESVLQRQFTKISLAQQVMKKTDDDAQTYGTAIEEDDDDDDDDYDYDRSDDGEGPKKRETSADDFGDDQVALSLSASETRDLFTLHSNTLSRTHDMMLCNCGEGKGKKVSSTLRKNLKLDALQSYSHHANVRNVPDPCLSAVSDPSLVSFCFSETRNE